MADLDDFFAKKDRKKSKSKGKFLSADEIAKKLEETTKRSESKPASSKKQPAVANEIETPVPDQESNDEWKEFEEERKDYTGLKLGQLTISEDEQQQTNFGNDSDTNTDGQNEMETTADTENSGTAGPWKKVQETPGIPNPEPEAPAKPASNIYISPAMRNQLANPIKSKLRKGVAPDLKNEEYFPTLGADPKADTSKTSKKDSTFEEVKHGGRQIKQSDLPSAQPLSIGNPYSSLSTDAS
uniref:Protein CDV3 homolog n=1 Tax=Corethrella appendiculata TaxID=1370023 RepID=U5EZG8_9DIPT